jgi:single-strand DNA-binding protein
MPNVNRVFIAGHLGQDPDLRYTQSQNAVCNLSIATTEKYKNPSGEQQESTYWARVVVWGKQAENCSKYLTKGSAVLVEGKLTERQWEDKEGNKRYVTEIVASNVQFLSGGKKKEDNQEAPPF